MPILAFLLLQYQLINFYKKFKKFTTNETLYYQIFNIKGTYTRKSIYSDTNIHH